MDEFAFQSAVRLVQVIKEIVGPHLEDRTAIHFARLIEENLIGFIPPSGF